MKYLPLYYECVKKGKLLDSGLCLTLNHPKELDTGGLLAPENTSGFWGYNGKNILGSTIWNRRRYYNMVKQKFTPLRQNLLLFLAAMNNEL